MEGLYNGFRIATKRYEGPDVRQINYRSATEEPNRTAVEKQILEEISNGRYLVTREPPRIISALAAIPKPGGNKIRLIHDCSRPHGGALNDLAEVESFKYQTLKDATEIIQPGDYLAKVDLASAYRSVCLHPEEHQLTGLQWTFSGDNDPTYIRDGRLPFGSSKSPFLFNSLTQAVRHLLAAGGESNIVAYLDDFLCVGRTAEECKQTRDHLMTTLRRLGFSINYSKVEGPAQTLVFLGVAIDTLEYTLSLPDGRLRELSEELRRFDQRKSATKRDLQSIVGKLNWSSAVVYGGRPHLRRIIDRINVLKAPGHKTRLTAGIREDLRWWIENIHAFNGCMPIAESREVTQVCVDACDEGAGGYHDGDWYHVRWLDWEDTHSLHINYKEVLALLPAVDLWGHLWRDKKVIVYSDNQAAVGILNRGTAKDPNVMGALRHLLWKSVIHNFRIKAVYYPGKQNVVADAASRLMEPGGWERLQYALAHTIIQC